MAKVRRKRYLPIFFVTGINTTGKSSLVPVLRRILPAQVVVYDFDQHGVPDGVTRDWRIRTTRHWIVQAKKNYRRGQFTLICGLAMPAEAVALARKHANMKALFILLRISRATLQRRLRARHNTPAKLRKLQRVTGCTLSECIAANWQHGIELERQARRTNTIVFSRRQPLIQTLARKIRATLLPEIEPG